ncbi:MAG: hypothetical protein ACJ72D_13840 [Marmoricola sp.]
MFKLFLALHLLAAVFAIGPLVHATTTASRGLRTGDGAATAASARIATLYSYASVVVVVFGFGLMSADAPWNKNEKVADMGDPFIWISLLLWLVALGLTLGVLVPSLKQATVEIANGAGVEGLKARVAASGGVVGLIFAAIIFLMVYKPGS